ncbi:zonadhesin-like isoform X2 [Nymphalis io]|uniref:zonadhesin-like isoform X2 n=1 Tax=Inachis io TaxID=171585 RepID=UPI002166FF31|nr:zonadhesin-like isoform X2 [Nymphalis io]
MEVLFYSLTFIAFVFVSGVNTDSFASSSAESKASADSKPYSSADASSSATSSSYTGNDSNYKPSEPECKKNEKEISCINSVCEYRNCSDIGKPIKCVRLDPRKCIRGCICENEYLRDDSTGLCIPKDQCPTEKCGVNEIYDICPPTCPPQRCDVDERLIRCAKNPEPGNPACKPGCRCIDDYKRNASGVCIPKNECFTCTGQNEVVGCQTLLPETCESIGKNYTAIEPAVCTPACRCKPGFYRNKIRDCISKEQCLKCTGPNEYFSCGSACDNVCTTLDTQNQTNCPIKNIVCNQKCYCDENYARDSNNTCIPIKDCPINKCGLNEIYDTCLPICPPPRCDVDEKTIQCLRNPEPGDPACKSGCRCIDNYKKNEFGVCIPKEECPIIPAENCGPDEEYVDCANGGCGRWECSQQGQICIELAEGDCVGGCRCKEPLLRAEDGSCIPADQCPPTTPSVICRDDEDYLECANGGCGRWECAQQRPICIDLVEDGCVGGCRCKAPLLRAEDGSCVPADQCPLICSGQNEVVGCRTACPETCESIGKNCTIIEAAVCIPDCRCKPGFYRNNNGHCISEKQCSNECGVNEIYDICPATCPPPRCDIDEKTILCLPNPKPGDSTCAPGCRCIDNYKKNESGICIPKEECPTTPSVICRDDEEYLECANGGCGRWECAQQGLICIDLLEGGCVGGCRCKAPLLRAEDGSCVPADQCPLICSGQNEVVGCRTACPETCESIGKNCTIIEAAVCIPDCRCKPGFYRNNNGHCVSEKQCSKECGVDEIYDICPPTCPPQRCDVDERVIRCAKNPEPGNPACKPGCRCIDNYKKNAFGVCIPKEECPGVVSCGPNEIISSCVNGGCGRWNCSQTGEICIKLPEDGCREGCHCIDTYLRADNGTCIPADQCPPTTQPVICRDDEYYLECSNGDCGRCAQEGQLCIDLIEGGCIPGCRCKEPLLRAEDGSCVPAAICTGQNEVVGCRTACSETCNSIGKNCTIIEPTVCIPACRCSPGFYRNADYICVPEDECPTKSTVCRSDEEYSGCANGGCGRWKCSQPGQICIDLIEGGCIPGCRCKKPLLRAENGSCIPADQCPPVCFGQNEVVGCETACPDSCESIDKNCTIIEPAVCQPSCRCKNGYYRNKNGVCISKKHCLQCSGPNESYSCGPGCDNVCATLSKENQTNCPIINNNYFFCNPMCYCDENYARDKYNICIHIEECPTNENGIKKLTDGNIVFTENFLRVASKMNTGVSAVYSPFSLLFLLAPLGLYTKGDSEQQILKALNLQSKSLIRSTIPLYLDELNSQKNVTLDLAARVYVNIQYKLSKAFEQDTKNLFKAEAQNLDFSKSEQAAKLINDWVEFITNNLIQNLVSPDTLSVNTRLVLVNAIYFKGDWLYSFKEENSEKQIFYVNENKNVTVNMMNQIGSFKYAEIENPNIQVLELPYVNRNLTFVVCLPKSKDGIEEFIDTLGNPSFSVLETAIKSLKYRTVDVSIPSMDVTTTTDLGYVLRQLNVTAIFEPENANFSGILEKFQQIFVSSATQKSTIIVTETGTKAAAANAIIVGVTSVLQPAEVTKFLADHPFAYFILYNGTPIFCGIYRGPE